MLRPGSRDDSGRSSGTACPVPRTRLELGHRNNSEVPCIKGTSHIPTLFRWRIEHGSNRHPNAVRIAARREGVVALPHCLRVCSIRENGHRPNLLRTKAGSDTREARNFIRLCKSRIRNYSCGWSPVLRTDNLAVTHLALQDSYTSEPRTVASSAENICNGSGQPGIEATSGGYAQALQQSAIRGKNSSMS
jgi:hypothetical protein